MDAIVYRDGIPCKLVKSGYKVTTWESKTITPTWCENGAEPVLVNTDALRGPVGGWDGTGQREVRITRRLLVVPLDNSDERHFLATCDGMGNDYGVDVDIEDLERKAENSRKKSQARAKRQCRYKIKHGGFRHMLTGTYRENMTDFDRMRKDFAAWLRKMRNVIPGFRAVHAFEPQKRGAWHFHCAVDSLPRFLRYKGKKLPSYEVCTLFWRNTVGDVPYEFVGPLLPGSLWPAAMVSGGTVNVDGYTVKRSRKKQHADAVGFSLAKMAQYVSKYLTKDLEQGLKGRQMWGSTEGLTPPKATVLYFPEGSMADIISIAFEVPAGHRVARHWLNSFGDCWVLDTEPIPA